MLFKTYLKKYCLLIKSTNHRDIGILHNSSTRSINTSTIKRIMSNPITKLKNIFFVATQQSIRIWIATKNLLIEVSWFFIPTPSNFFFFWSFYNHKNKKAAHMFLAYIFTIGAIIAYLKLYGSTPVCYSCPIIDDDSIPKLSSPDINDTKIPNTPEAPKTPTPPEKDWWSSIKERYNNLSTPAKIVVAGLNAIGVAGFLEFTNWWNFHPVAGLAPGLIDPTIAAIISAASIFAVGIIDPTTAAGIASALTAGVVSGIMGTAAVGIIDPALAASFVNPDAASILTVAAISAAAIIDPIITTAAVSGFVSGFIDPGAAVGVVVGLTTAFSAATISGSIDLFTDPLISASFAASTDPTVISASTWGVTAATASALTAGVISGIISASFAAIIDSSFIDPIFAAIISASFAASTNPLISASFAAIIDPSISAGITAASIDPSIDPAFLIANTDPSIVAAIVTSITAGVVSGIISASLAASLAPGLTDPSIIAGITAGLITAFAAITDPTLAPSFTDPAIASDLIAAIISAAAASTVPTDPTAISAIVSAFIASTSSSVDHTTPANGPFTRGGSFTTPPSNNFFLQLSNLSSSLILIFYFLFASFLASFIASFLIGKKSSITSYIISFLTLMSSCLVLTIFFWSSRAIWVSTSKKVLSFFHVYLKKFIIIFKESHSKLKNKFMLFKTYLKKYCLLIKSTNHRDIGILHNSSTRSINTSTIKRIMSNPSTKLKNIFFVATQQSIRIWIATKNVLIEVFWFFIPTPSNFFFFWSFYNHKSKKAAHMFLAYIFTIGAIIAYLKLYGSTPVCYSCPIIDDDSIPKLSSPDINDTKIPNTPEAPKAPNTPEAPKAPNTPEAPKAPNTPEKDWWSSIKERYNNLSTPAKIVVSTAGLILSAVGYIGFISWWNSHTDLNITPSTAAAAVLASTAVSLAVTAQVLTPAADPAIAPSVAPILTAFFAAKTDPVTVAAFIAAFSAATGISAVTALAIGLIDPTSAKIFIDSALSVPAAAAYTAALSTLPDKDNILQIIGTLGVTSFTSFFSPPIASGVAASFVANISPVQIVNFFTIINSTITETRFLPDAYLANVADLLASVGMLTIAATVAAFNPLISAAFVSAFAKSIAASAIITTKFRAPGLVSDGIDTITTITIAPSVASDLAAAADAAASTVPTDPTVISAIFIAFIASTSSSVDHTTPANGPFTRGGSFTTPPSNNFFLQLSNLSSSLILIFYFLFASFLASFIASFLIGKKSSITSYIISFLTLMSSCLVLTIFFWSSRAIWVSTSKKVLSFFHVYLKKFIIIFKESHSKLKNKFMLFKTYLKKYCLLIKSTNHRDIGILHNSSTRSINTSTIKRIMSNPITKLKNIFFVATQQSIRIWIATKNLLIEVFWFFIPTPSNFFFFWSFYNHKSKKAAHMFLAYIFTIGAIIAYLKLYGSTPVCYSCPIIDDDSIPKLSSPDINDTKTPTPPEEDLWSSIKERYNNLSTPAKIVVWVFGVLGAAGVVGLISWWNSHPDLINDPIIITASALTAVATTAALAASFAANTDPSLSAVATAAAAAGIDSSFTAAIIAGVTAYFTAASFVNPDAAASVVAIITTAALVATATTTTASVIDPNVAATFINLTTTTATFTAAITKGLASGVDPGVIVTIIVSAFIASTSSSVDPTTAASIAAAFVASINPTVASIFTAATAATLSLTLDLTLTANTAAWITWGVTAAIASGVDPASAINIAAIISASFAASLAASISAACIAAAPAIAPSVAAAASTVPTDPTVISAIVSAFIASTSSSVDHTTPANGPFTRGGSFTTPPSNNFFLQLSNLSSSLILIFYFLFASFLASFIASFLIGKKSSITSYIISFLTLMSSCLVLTIFFWSSRAIWVSTSKKVLSFFHVYLKKFIIIFKESHSKLKNKFMLFKTYLKKYCLLIKSTNHRDIGILHNSSTRSINTSTIKRIMSNPITKLKNIFFVATQQSIRIWIATKNVLIEVFWFFIPTPSNFFFFWSFYNHKSKKAAHMFLVYIFTIGAIIAYLKLYGSTPVCYSCPIIDDDSIPKLSSPDINDTKIPNTPEAPNTPEKDWWSSIKERYNNLSTPAKIVVSTAGLILSAVGYIGFISWWNSHTDLNITPSTAAAAALASTVVSLAVTAPTLAPGVDLAIVTSIAATTAAFIAANTDPVTTAVFIASFSAGVNISAFATIATGLTDPSNIKIFIDPAISAATAVAYTAALNAIPHCSILQIIGTLGVTSFTSFFSPPIASGVAASLVANIDHATIAAFFATSASILANPSPTPADYTVAFIALGIAAAFAAGVNPLIFSSLIATFSASLTANITAATISAACIAADPAIAPSVAAAASTVPTDPTVISAIFIASTASTSFETPTPANGPFTRGGSFTTPPSNNFFLQLSNLSSSLILIFYFLFASFLASFIASFLIGKKSSITSYIISFLTLMSSCLVLTIFFWSSRAIWVSTSKKVLSFFHVYLKKFIIIFKESHSKLKNKFMLFKTYLKKYCLLIKSTNHRDIGILHNSSTRSINTSTIKSV